MKMRAASTRVPRVSNVRDVLASANTSPSNTVTGVVKEPVKLVPGVGTLTIKKKTRGVQTSMPSWRGRRVRGGELYQDDAPSPPDPRPLFTLVGSSAVTIMWPQPGAREEDSMNFLSEVACTWEGQ